MSNASTFCCLAMMMNPKIPNNKKKEGIPNTHGTSTRTTAALPVCLNGGLNCAASSAALTQTAAAEVLPETHVAQLVGRDLGHLQSHSGTLSQHLHAHAHGPHLQQEHRHLEGQEDVKQVESWTNWTALHHICCILTDIANTSCQFGHLLKTLQGVRAYYVFGGLVSALGGGADGVRGRRPLVLVNYRRFSGALLGDGVLEA